jgi:hypothetical protein
MSGITINFPSGLEFAPCDVRPSSGNSLSDQSGARRGASTTQFNRWRFAMLILLFCFLPVAMFGAATPVAISSPAAGSVLTGSTVTFSWAPETGVSAYVLWLGSNGQGSSSLFNSGGIQKTSVTVTGLPMNGATIYATLYSAINGVFKPVYITYKAAPSPSPATLTSPVAGSVLTGSSATFSWKAVTGVTTYQLLLGTGGQGSSSIYNSGHLTTNSVTVTGLPTKGAPLYASLYSSINGVMTPVYSTYTESGGAAAAAVSAVTCSSTIMNAIGTYSCTVTLSAAAASGGQTVSLSSSNAAITVPSTVTVAASASSAVFMADVVSLAASKTVTLTATACSVSKSFAVQLVAASNPLGINATSVSFGDVAVNSSSTQSITLTATGSAPVTISTATLAGTGFTLPGATLPMTLNPGQAVSLNVQFAPTAAGAVTGQLTISSNASTGGKAVIALSGTGSSYAVGLTWDAPANSPVAVTGYNIYRSPSGTSTYELVNSSVETLTTYTDSTVQSGQTYDYVIESVDNAGVESTPSNMASVVVP